MLFHKIDTLKQAAIGRATLSVCEPLQREANKCATASFIDRNAASATARSLHPKPPGDYG